MWEDKLEDVVEQRARDLPVLEELLQRPENPVTWWY